MPQTTVSESTFTDGDDNERTQYSTTVPKGLAEGFDLAGKKLDWEVKNGTTFEVSIVDDE